MFLLTNVITHTNGINEGRIFTYVCLFVTISKKTLAARIIKLDIEIES